MFVDVYRGISNNCLNSKVMHVYCEIQWLTTGNLKLTEPTLPALPDPGDCARPREAAVFQAAHDAFETIITCATDSSFATLRKRKRNEYYNQEVRYCDI